MNFIGEDDLSTFEGFLKYQGIDLSTAAPEQVENWLALFHQAQHQRESTPKVGRMNLRFVEGEQRYAVAIREGDDLWLALWIRCSPKGEVFILYPRSDRRWDPHASYHFDGAFHQKSYGEKAPFAADIKGAKRCQPLASFRGVEELGTYAGFGGKSVGAICDPTVFTEVVIVDSGILGPYHGAVQVALVEPGLEPEISDHVAVFKREERPSVVITVSR